jgi:uncharacterized protein (TIGR02611 family)
VSERDPGQTRPDIGAASDDSPARQVPAPSDGDDSPDPPRSHSSGRREAPPLVQRLQRRREAHRLRSLPYRVAWVTAALFVIVVGLLMIVLPGPALVVIPIGLAMLSLEFAWAERLLDRTLERGAGARDMAKNASGRQKAAGIAAIVCAVAAVAAAALLILT